MADDRVKQAVASQLLGLKGITTHTQRKMAGAAAELAVRDIIEQCLKCLEQFGPGVLTVQTDKDGYTRWVDPEEIQANLETAQRAGDDKLVELQRRMLDRLASFEANGAVLILLCSNRGLRLYELSVDTAGDRARHAVEAYRP